VESDGLLMTSFPHGARAVHRPTATLRKRPSVEPASSSDQMPRGKLTASTMATMATMVRSCAVISLASAPFTHRLSAIGALPFYFRGGCIIGTRREPPSVGAPRPRPFQPRRLRQRRRRSPACHSLTSTR
jgi:hypothetical protein